MRHRIRSSGDGDDGHSDQTTYDAGQRTLHAGYHQDDVNRPQLLDTLEQPVQPGDAYISDVSDLEPDRASDR